MFKGKSALITGGSSGIGKAIANKLAEEGASITLIARDPMRLRNAAELLPTPYEQKHHYQSLDLLHLVDQRNPGLVTMEKLLNKQTILVNCAGITQSSLLQRTTQQSIMDILNLNLAIPILLSQLAIKPMLRNKSQMPSILNIGSILSYTHFNVAGTSVYNASKSGLLGFTQSIAHELKGRIRINALLPGLVLDTGMSEHAHKHIQPVLETPVVAEKAVSILMDENMNGKCVVLNYGMKP